MAKKTLERVAIAGLIGLLLVGFFYFDLGHYLTLSYLKESQHRFNELYVHHTALVILCYALIYIVTTALSLPGAAILTLAGGAMFGLYVGSVVVSFASSIGATLACFVSRFLLRDWVHNRFGQRLGTINDGIAKEGAFYLFSLRLVPIFPFFVINLLMGLTRMPLFTYYWVSQIGMFPATVVYVNAGKELASIDSASGIISPGLLFSFALLGLFPIVTKKLLGLRGRTVNRKMSSKSPD